MLFSKLISDYGIEGNFLKVLSALYTDHKVFVKLSDGLFNQSEQQLDSNKVAVYRPYC